MKRKSLFFLGISLMLLGACGNEVKKTEPAIVEVPSKTVEENKLIKVDGTVIGFSDDKKNIFVQTSSEELAFSFKEAMNLNEGDSIYLEYLQDEVGTKEIKKVSVIPNLESAAHAVKESTEKENTEKENTEKENLDKESSEKETPETNSEETVSEGVSPTLETSSGESKKTLNDMGIYLGIVDNHSIEIKIASETNVFNFPESLSGKVDSLTIDSEISLTYFSNSDGQFILTDIQ